VIAVDALARTGEPRAATTGRRRIGPAPEAPGPIAPLSVTTTAMGGRLTVHVDATAWSPATGRSPDVIEQREFEDRARRDAGRVLARVGRWAGRLSRHLPESELSLLNADPRPAVHVGPTLAAALRAGIDAGEASGGLVDVTLLDARLAAEGLAPAPSRPGLRAWNVAPGPEPRATVCREPGVHFDLGGVAKGWLADRALALLRGWSSVAVDADGDLAIQAAPGRRWAVAVDDPRNGGTTLAILALAASRGGWGERWGVATSGTSVHRWQRDGIASHHLIDPRTGAPALTDVVQATVICASALRAEALAKATVILGSMNGLALLERVGVRGAIVLTDRGDVIAVPSTLALLAG
jgi:thiamine biosynthesis lipoprotein